MILSSTLQRKPSLPKAAPAISCYQTHGRDRTVFAPILYFPPREGRTMPSCPRPVTPITGALLLSLLLTLPLAFSFPYFLLLVNFFPLAFKYAREFPILKDKSRPQPPGPPAAVVPSLLTKLPPSELPVFSSSPPMTPCEIQSASVPQATQTVQVHSCTFLAPADTPHSSGPDPSAAVSGLLLETLFFPPPRPLLLDLLPFSAILLKVLHLLRRPWIPAAWQAPPFRQQTAP